MQALWQGLWRWQGGCRNQVAPHVREEAALFRAEAVEERALEEGEMSRIQ